MAGQFKDSTAWFRLGVKEVTEEDSSTTKAASRLFLLLFTNLQSSSYTLVDSAKRNLTRNGETTFWVNLAQFIGKMSGNRLNVKLLFLWEFFLLLDNWVI